MRLEKPEKTNEEDLEIKLRFASVSRNEKLKLLIVVFSDNSVFVYDLNKILKVELFQDENEKEEVKLIKKYYELEGKITEKITALESIFN